MREHDPEVVRREPLLVVLPRDHPLATADAVPFAQLAAEPFIAYPSQFRCVVRDAVEAVCSAHGFLPKVAVEISETSTLVSFVAAGLGVSLVPESVRHMTVQCAVYRPLESLHHLSHLHRHVVSVRADPDSSCEQAFCHGRDWFELVAVLAP